MSATAILSALAGALRGGGVKPAAHLDIREGVQRLVVEHDEPFPYQVDGDALGRTRRRGGETAIREGTRRAATRPHSFEQYTHYRGDAATDTRHSHHFRDRFRSGR